ncbi:MAG: substrate-binding domain-containing protein [Chloroflexi bacterium]|nr:substrate-binding domain-containing protein [Chloroflexota bacterium]
MKLDTMPPSAARLLRTLAAISLAAGAALGACAPAPTPSPTPGPVPRVAVTLPFAPLALGWAQSYVEQAGPLPFDLEVVHASAAMEGLKQGDYEVAIGALEPEEGWFATPLASDPIAVVTGGDAGLREVTSAALVEIFSGRVTDWSTLGGSTRPVQPVVPLPDDDLRAVLDDQLMRGRPFASGSRLIADPEQALALLNENPGAIALIPLSALPEDATPLRLDGVLPSQGGSTQDGYGLVATILAIAPDEPDGPVRDWLAWVQATQGKTAGN